MPTGKGPLRIAIEDFIEGFEIGKRVQTSFDKYVEGKAGGFIKDPVTLKAPGTEGIVNVIRDVFYSLEFENKSFFEQLVIGAGLTIAVVTSLGNAISQPFMSLWTYSINRIVRPARFSPGELAAMYFKAPEHYNTYKDDAIDNGYDTNRLEAVIDTSRQFLTAFEYQVLWRRGFISDSAYKAKINALGIKDEDHSNLTRLGEVIPTVQDLIYMQVKEAFNDEASNRFQHDEGDKSGVTEWAEKQGLNADWVNKYWRAHWQLPSPNQVFEMLQRLRPGVSDTPVTDDDVSTFLQMADYSPFWRDRLKQISYSPYTRVDIRRMFKVGVLDYDGIIAAYQDAGYDLERATKLAEFTVKYETEEETRLSLSAITSAYDDGMIDRVTAESQLIESGYDTTSIKFYLDNIDYKHTLQVNKIKLDNIRKRYLEGDLDETTINNEINLINIPTEKGQALIDLWTTERNSQVVLPTLAQIEKFYEMGIASLDDFKRILSLRGYNEETIKWNIERIDIEKQIAAKKAADDADKEIVKLLKNDESSQYQIDKADIDLAIAQAKANITDIDIALHGEISDDDAITLQQRKDELKSFIAAMNVEKAQLKFENKTELERLSSSLESEG